MLAQKKEETGILSSLVERSYCVMKGSWYVNNSDESEN